MSQDIFIGVDGGGTKSKIRIEDRAGNVLGQAVGGPANIRVSVVNAWKSIYETIDSILAPLNISLQDHRYNFHAGFGLAGCEVKDAYDTFLKETHPFKTIELISDAHAACVGAHQGKDGAIIIVGTGVVGYQALGDTGSKVGGWGFPHDDEGGGAWLGLEASRLTFQWLDQRCEKSPLVEDVYSFFNQDLEQFITWANRADSREYARLAPLVINHSQQEEIVAVRLMKKAASAVSRIAHGLEKLRGEEFENLPCCLTGGIGPFVEPWLSDELRATLVPRVAGASAGAILFIREKAKLD